MLNRLRYGKIVDIIGGEPKEAGCPCCGVFGMDGRDIKDRLMVPAGPTAWKQKEKKKGENPSITSTNPESKEIERLEGEKRKEELKRSFSIFSYQTTSQSLCSKANFPKSIPSALKWKNRARTLLSEIVSRKADIVCLQGLEESRVFSFWVKRLAQYGYAMIPSPKQQHQEPAQGNALTLGTPTTSGGGKEGESDETKVIDGEGSRSSSNSQSRTSTSFQPSYSRRRSPCCRVISSVFYQRRNLVCDTSFCAHDGKIAGGVLRFKDTVEQGSGYGSACTSTSSSSSSSSSSSGYVEQGSGYGSACTSTSSSSSSSSSSGGGSNSNNSSSSAGSIKSSGGNVKRSGSANDRQSVNSPVLNDAFMIVSTDLSKASQGDYGDDDRGDGGGGKVGISCQGKSSLSAVDPVDIVRRFLEEIAGKYEHVSVVLAGDFGADFQPGSAKYNSLLHNSLLHNSNSGGGCGARSGEQEGDRREVGNALPAQFLDSYAFRLKEGGFATTFPPESKPSVTDYIFCIQDGRLVVADVLELQHHKALLESEGALPSQNFGSFHLSLCALVHTSAFAKN
eukprot:CAMPEP_0185280592 /NCGR_PEP_ID=MMETSP1359-20130426/66218_1 /TAXON_ID=552665 /ORGANISM="Bigelowiella longifila, Strain CCMP242" /LENGTH=563 /DNA_ID=CAMNT_0027875877 /DNA_START=111 /DNA_END=1803 /DNA_ORIENTATION=-